MSCECDIGRINIERLNSVSNLVRVRACVIDAMVSNCDEKFLQTGSENIFLRYWKTTEKLHYFIEVSQEELQ